MKEIKDFLSGDKGLPKNEELFSLFGGAVATALVNTVGSPKGKQGAEDLGKEEEKEEVEATI